MAQDRADLTPTPALDPEHLERMDSIETIESTDMHELPSMSSIDNLLAITDDGWDIDDQVRTLQNAAVQVPVPTQSKSARDARRGDSGPSVHGPLHVPTPFDLAPGAAPKKGQSIPPPLPPRASKAPVPSVAPRKGPPPLPKVEVSPSASMRAASPVKDAKPLQSESPLSPTLLIELLGARAATLETGEDKVALARAQMELAIANEVLGDEGRAVVHAEAALKIDPDLAAAHSLLRRKKHGRGAMTAMLGHLDHELAAATAEAARVELLIERARLLEATGDKPSEVRAAWSQALTHAPHHAVALKGLETELATRVNQLTASPGAPAALPEAYDALSAHLGHMADAYASEPPLAAWLHVERALILEKKLGRVDAARGALERALSLAPGVGPVRDAMVRHVSVQQDAAALVALLEQEAQIEANGARSARLELEAACIAQARLGDPGRAILLLERAAARAPTTTSVDRRVLDDLVLLHEAAGRWTDASRARRARLRFVTDPPFVAQELRTLATIMERAGDVDVAIADVQRALAIDAADPSLTETLDRLLAAAKKDEQRVALWLTEAARTEEGPKRAKALARAANIAEHTLARPADAVRHLRSAWIASPGDTEVLDALARLLAPAPSETVDGEARALIDLYAQAAETAHDDARRVAYLEKIALVWEDLIGDARRATRTYEDILRLEPDRRGAVLGLARTAARVGDDRALARALLDEARLADDGVDVLTLKTRAATALARVDSARALSLVTDVLTNEPAHTAARALATRLHEEAGRWELAADCMRARIEHAPRHEKMPLLLALAHVEETRLHAPLRALASLKAARALDPKHPVPPDAMVRLLEGTGDFRTLRDAIEALANDATAKEDRARHLVRAAEIDELRLGDDARAANLYTRALAESPDDAMIVDRLTRLLARRAHAATSVSPTEGRSLLHAGLPPGARSARASVPPPPGLPPPALTPPPARVSQPPPGMTPPAELAALLGKRLERPGSPEAALAMTFDLAALLVELGQDLSRATTLLESVVAEQADHIPALRTLEALLRRTQAWAPLSRVMSRQADAFHDVRARMGALWHLAALEEWRLPVSNAAQTYERILGLDPTDPGALEATLRRELTHARRGDNRARKAVIGAMRALCALAAEDSSRLAIQLRVAIMLEQIAGEGTDATTIGAAREALERYKEALELDPLSVTATTGLARLAGRLNDTKAAYTAALALAELAVEPHVRSRYLIDAAELLLVLDAGDMADDRSARPGPHGEEARQERAATLLERALDSDPDSIPAATRLADIRVDLAQGERLVDTFRAAIRRAQTPEAIIMLGSEIARVARDDMRDLTIAIDAMRRVRESAPQHVPSLLTLAELCIAQRAWPEAVDALESVVSTSREPAPKLTALFALGSIYDKVLARPADAERVLRAALAVDPESPRALRALLRRLASTPHSAGGSVKDVNAEQPRPAAPEIAELLGRLADVESDPEQKCGILLELAEIRLSLRDDAAAEHALIEAVAHSPSNATAIGRLASLCKGTLASSASGGPGGVADLPSGSSQAGKPKAPDYARYARALASLIGRGQQLGKVDARWLATLGQLEIESLGRLRDGIVHLQRAVQMDATLYETRFELAGAFARASANEEASRTLLALIMPESQPLLAIAKPGLALALLERTLGVEQRAEEALVVSELRAVAGELDDGRHAWLRARRLGPVEPHHGQLDRAALVTHVLPPEGRHVLLEVAAAVAGIESKMLRADLTDLGLSARDRVSPRSGHPTRALLDRVARTLGVAEVELVVSTAVTRTRVLSNDQPWVVVPRGLTELPEPAQIAALARAVARIALGVPWLEELPPPHIEAFLIAAARQVVPKYGAEDVDVLSSKAVAQYEPSVARLLSRRQKKLLEELAPHIASPQGRPMPIDAFVGAIARAELRAAYIVSGDLLATIDEVRGFDAALFQATDRPGAPALRSVLEHPFAGDICRFALTSEATALRRRIGSSWTG